MLTRVIAQKNSPVHCPVIVKAEVAMNGPYRCRFRLCLDGPFSAGDYRGRLVFFRASWSSLPPTVVDAALAGESRHWSPAAAAVTGCSSCGCSCFCCCRCRRVPLLSRSRKVLSPVSAPLYPARLPHGRSFLSCRPRHIRSMLVPAPIRALHRPNARPRRRHGPSND